MSRKSLGWHIGDRSDKSLKVLIDKIDNQECAFVTDNWEGFFRVLPLERHFFGKDLTYPIEQTNSDIRHRLARFKRKTKASSRSIDMVHNSIKLFHFFQEDFQNVVHCMKKFLAFFS